MFFYYYFILKMKTKKRLCKRRSFDFFRENYNLMNNSMKIIPPVIFFKFLIKTGCN